jgi:hypothetical protein
MVAGLSLDVGFVSLPNSSSHVVALGSTQSLTEMTARDLPEAKVVLARKADKEH